MGSLNSLYIKTDVLEKVLQVLKQKNEKGIEITISINDETNDYGQNLSSFVAQSKEERESKKPKFYIGNGKCFWTDGKITVAEKKDNPKQANNTSSTTVESDDLPF